MRKRILILFFCFSLVFNITVTNYNQKNVLGADVVVVGGAVYGATEIIKLFVALCVACGGAYVIDQNKENIGSIATTTFNGYKDYLNVKNEVTAYSSNLFMDFLNENLPKVKDASISGIDYVLNIPTNLYQSFKTYLNECMIDKMTYDKIFSSSQGNLIFIDGVSPDILNRYSDLDLTYFDGENSRGFISYDDYMYKGVLHDGMSTGRSTINGTTINGINDVYRITYTTQLDDTEAVYKIYYEGYNSYGSWKRSSHTIITDIGAPVKFYLYNCNLNNTVLDNNEVIENYDIPEWRKPLENNDIHITSLNNILSNNYDVISSKNSQVLTDNPDLVNCPRDVTMPNLDDYQRIRDGYINGQLSYEDYINALNKLIGVTGVNVGGDGVIVGDNGLTIPVDTPVDYPIPTTNTGTTVGDMLNEREKEEEKEDEKEDEKEEEETNNEDTIKGYPDLTDYFPFCIPFDILKLLNSIKTEPEIPHFEIPVDIDVFNVHYTIVIDFEQFSNLSTILRTFLALIWTAFLILKSRNLVKG